MGKKSKEKKSESTQKSNDSKTTIFQARLLMETNHLKSLQSRKEDDLSKLRKELEEVEKEWRYLENERKNGLERLLEEKRKNDQNKNDTTQKDVLEAIERKKLIFDQFNLQYENEISKEKKKKKSAMELLKKIEHDRTFRDKMKKENENMIEQLEKEKEESINRFSVISDYLKKLMKKNKDEEKVKAENIIYEKQTKEADKVLQFVDKETMKKMTDNIWIEKECEIHRKEQKNILEDIKKEKEEIENLLRNLFSSVSNSFQRDTYLDKTYFDDDTINSKKSKLLLLTMSSENIGRHLEELTAANIPSPTNQKCEDELIENDMEIKYSQIEWPITTDMLNEILEEKKKEEN
ncbi:hypothetical protein SNEBB_004031 [Seison nebaliae]|nr:hypothetical protein SNEBB_004031 [Seison nebaliae]